MIYLVEDDNSIRELVAYTLNGAGYETIGFEEPKMFWSAIEDCVPELILLDIMLPDEDGLSILKKLKENANTKMIPVIMLTALGTEYDKVVGLDSGADDYVAKPFGMMELLARVRARLRQFESHHNKTEQFEYNIGNLQVSRPRHEVRVNGNIIDLTLKEFEMLCCLLENMGNAMTRDRLLDIVWGYDFDGESRTVDVHVRTLRQKLGSCGDYITTIRGIGYVIRNEE